MSVAARQLTRRAVTRVWGPALLLLWAAPYALAAYSSITSSTSPLDLNVFLATGKALIAGDAPYSLRGTNDLSAPASLPFFHALAAVHSAWTPVGWYVASLSAYLLSVSLLARMYPNLASASRQSWAIAQCGLWTTLALGQVYALLLLPFTLAYWAIRENRLLFAGLAAGLVIAFKPNFVLWPLLLLLTGRRRLALALIGGALLWCIPPVLLYGPEAYVLWLELARLRTPIELANPANASIESLAYRLGFGWIGLPLSALAFLGIAGWALRTRPSTERLGPVAILSGILLSPVAWVGYVCFLIPGFFSRAWNRPVTLAAALLLVPLWFRAIFGEGFSDVWGACNALAYGFLAIGLLLPDRPSAAMPQLTGFSDAAVSETALPGGQTGRGTGRRSDA